MSTYFIKGKGWRFDFTLRGNRFTSNWFKTKAEARKAEALKRKEAMLPEVELPPAEPRRPLGPPPPPELKTPPGPIPTGLAFSTLANSYLDQAKRRFTPRTYKFKVNVYREFLAFGGDLPAAEITLPLLEAYLKTRSGNINYNRHRKELYALFNWGCRRRYLRENPCTYLEKMPEPQFQRQIPTPEEMSRILEAAGPDRPFLLVIYHTLARVDEILRLKWEDINFRDRTVKLWTRKRQGGFWASDVLPMNRVLHDTLKDLWEARSQEEWVFYNESTGTRYLSRPKIMRSICQRAGVRHFGFHAIRHYVASLLADRKQFSVTQISRLLRHQSKSTTERYLQAVDSQLREVLASLEESSQEKFHINSHMDSREGSPKRERTGFGEKNGMET